MMNMFTDRTPRERGLIFAAAALLIVFLSWQFAVKPVLDAHNTAERAQITALRDFGIVQSGLPQISQTDNSNKRPFNRAAVIQIANQSGVTISRVQPGVDDALQVWFEDAQVGNVYNFLTRLTDQYATRVGRVQINRRQGGVVSAQITLQPSS